MASLVGKLAHEGAKNLQIFIYGHFLACSDKFDFIIFTINFLHSQRREYI